MARKDLIRNQLKQYLEKVSADIPIDRAYIVGSWAKGKARAESDVDLLILSPKFARMDIDERLAVLYRQTVGIDFDLHIHAVTSEEYEKASSLTTLGAMKHERKITLA